MNDFPELEDRAAPAASLLTTGREDAPEESQKFRTDATPVPSAAKPAGSHHHMNRSNHRELIVSGIHFELTPSLKTYVQEKADRLFRHEEKIVRMRVELECDPKEEVATRFKAKGHILIHGPDLNAVVESDECHKAVALLVDKLDRMLRRRARWQKVRRRRSPAPAFDALANAY
jgi:putative sigma-54 modulation protein